MAAPGSDVYLNGKFLLMRAKTPGRCQKAENAPPAIPPSGIGLDEKILEPEQTVYQWYCESDQGKHHPPYANFQGADLNEECVEINVRKVLLLPGESRRKLHYGARL